MRVPDGRLMPDWDQDNATHIARHGIEPEQVEEIYYGEGPLPTLAIHASRRGESRYRLWGVDAGGLFLEVIVAPYPKYGVWRCVTAYPMSEKTRRAYLRRLK